MKTLFFVLLVSLLSNISQAKEFKGVNFPDEVKVGSTSLKLNGVAVRKAMSIVTVYVAALYTAAPSKDAEAIIDSDTPKQIIFHYKYGCSKYQIVDAINEGFAKNKIDGYNYREDFPKLKDIIVPMSENDVGVVTFYKDHVDVKNKDAPAQTIQGANFSKQYLRVFIHNPPDDDVKAGLLGQNN